MTYIYFNLWEDFYLIIRVCRIWRTGFWNSVCWIYVYTTYAVTRNKSRTHKCWWQLSAYKIHVTWKIYGTIICNKMIRLAQVKMKLWRLKELNFVLSYFLWKWNAFRTKTTMLLLETYLVVEVSFVWLQTGSNKRY